MEPDRPQLISIGNSLAGLDPNQGRLAIVEPPHASRIITLMFLIQLPFLAVTYLVRSEKYSLKHIVVK